jgi:membrane-bound ClpP family serine protease
MEWLPIVSFIALGLILIIAEVIFVPGTTVVGIGGFLSMGYGIYQAYEIYGNTLGTLTLFGSLLVSIFLFYLSFKNRSWERFSLKNTMQGKVNQDYQFPLHEGDRGLTISSLKPIGNAIFQDKEIEVR